MRDSFPTGKSPFPERENTPTYEGGSEPQEDSMEIIRILYESHEVILDPSALPLLPKLTRRIKINKHPELTICVPDILYRLLGVPNGEAQDPTSEYLQRLRPQSRVKLARRALRPWTRSTSTATWQSVREALTSQFCRPIWPMGDSGREIQSLSNSAFPSGTPIPISNTSGIHLESLVLGQELGSAAENKLPILTKRDQPITALSARTMFTKLITSAHKHFTDLVDLKQEAFNRWFNDWPKKTKGERWYLAFVLQTIGLIPNPSIQIPAWLAGFFLQVLDP